MPSLAASTPCCRLSWNQALSMVTSPPPTPSAEPWSPPSAPAPVISVPSMVAAVRAVRCSEIAVVSVLTIRPPLRESRGRSASVMIGTTDSTRMPKPLTGCPSPRISAIVTSVSEAEAPASAR